MRTTVERRRAAPRRKAERPVTSRTDAPVRSRAERRGKTKGGCGSGPGAIITTGIGPWARATPRPGWTNGPLVAPGEKNSPGVTVPPSRPEVVSKKRDENGVASYGVHEGYAQRGNAERRERRRPCCWITVLPDATMLRPGLGYAPRRRPFRRSEQFMESCS